MITALILLLYAVPVILGAIYPRIAYASGIFVSVFAAAFSIVGLIYRLNLNETIGPFSVSLNPLSIFFLLVISTVSALVNIYSMSYEKSPGRGVWILHGSIFSMALVTLSSSMFPFLFGWESMTIFGYYLLGFRTKSGNIPPYVFLVFGELSTLLILLGFAGFYSQYGTFSFIPGISGTALFLLLIGFQIKMGIIPFQITEWLPIAHGQAPANASVIFSAGMTTVAIYSTIRFVLLADASLLIGLLLLSIGIFSLFFASIYSASSEHIKMLPAYSTIENCGAMIMLIGSYLIFSDLGLYEAALFALTGALIFVFAHAMAKSAIFLFVGMNEKHRNTHDFLNLGEDKNSRISSTGGALSSFSLMGLLPIGGGVGEWFLLESLFIMSTVNNFYVTLMAVISGALAALGLGFSVVSFTKSYGFLSRGGRTGQKSDYMDSAILIASLATVAIGIFSYLIVADSLFIFSPYIGGTSNNLLTGLYVVPSGYLISSIGPYGIFGAISPALLGVILGLFMVLSIGILGTGETRYVEPWNNGIAKDGNFNSFAYSNILRITMHKLYFTRETEDHGRYSESTFDVFWVLLVRISRGFVSVSRYFGRKFMNSSLNIYVFYILFTFFLILAAIAI